MSFDAIKPYLRFVRYVTLHGGTVYDPSTPYDARLFYALEGEGEIEAGGVLYPMRRSSLLIVNSGVSYHIRTPRERVLYLTVNFDYTFAAADQKTPVPPDAPCDYEPKNLINHVTFSDASELDEVFYLSELPSVEKRLLSMQREYAERLQLHELRSSAYMTDVLVECHRHATVPHPVAKEQQIAGTIVSYLQQNYAAPLTNRHVAALFHYHPNYISDLIKRYTGQPLHRYLKSIRVSHAADMLALSAKSVQEVAAECGFYDASHMVKCFREQLGMTPRQYRDYR